MSRDKRRAFSTGISNSDSMEDDFGSPLDPSSSAELDLVLQQAQTNYENMKLQGTLGGMETPTSPRQPLPPEQQWLGEFRKFIEEQNKLGKIPSKLEVLKILSRSLTKDELNQFPQLLRDKLPKDIFFTTGTENQKQNIAVICKNFHAESFEEALKDQEEDDNHNLVKSPTTYSRTGNRINVAVEELTRPSFQGYLQKQGNRVQTWKRRWCVLQDFCLYYFKTPKDLTALGIVTLPSYKIVLATGNRKHSFLATHSNMRTYCFQADNEEEMKAWVHAMQLASVCRYH